MSGGAERGCAVKSTSSHQENITSGTGSLNENNSSTLSESSSALGEGGERPFHASSSSYSLGTASNASSAAAAQSIPSASSSGRHGHGVTPTPGIIRHPSVMHQPLSSIRSPLAPAPPTMQRAPLPPPALISRAGSSTSILSSNRRLGLSASSTGGGGNEFVPAAGAAGTSHTTSPASSLFSPQFLGGAPASTGHLSFQQQSQHPPPVSFSAAAATDPPFLSMSSQQSPLLSGVSNFDHQLNAFQLAAAAAAAANILSPTSAIPAPTGLTPAAAASSASGGLLSAAGPPTVVSSHLVRISSLSPAAAAPPPPPPPSSSQHFTVGAAAAPTLDPFVAAAAADSLPTNNAANVAAAAAATYKAAYTNAILAAAAGGALNIPGFSLTTASSEPSSAASPAADAAAPNSVLYGTGSATVVHSAGVPAAPPSGPLTKPGVLEGTPGPGPAINRDQSSQLLLSGLLSRHKLSSSSIGGAAAASAPLSFPPATADIQLTNQIRDHQQLQLLLLQQQHDQQQRQAFDTAAVLSSFATAGSRSNLIPLKERPGGVPGTVTAVAADSSNSNPLSLPFVGVGVGGGGSVVASSSPSAFFTGGNDRRGKHLAQQQHSQQQQPPPPSQHILHNNTDILAVAAALHSKSSHEGVVTTSLPSPGMIPIARLPSSTTSYLSGDFLLRGRTSATGDGGIPSSSSKRPASATHQFPQVASQISPFLHTHTSSDVDTADCSRQSGEGRAPLQQLPSSSLLRGRAVGGSGNIAAAAAGLGVGTYSFSSSSTNLRPLASQSYQQAQADLLQQERQSRPSPLRAPVTVSSSDTSSQLEGPPPSSDLRHPPHFKSGSLIRLANGNIKRVQDLSTTDFALSADISPDFKLDASRVMSIKNLRDKPAVELFFSVGNGMPVRVEATREHPFYVFDKGWSSPSPFHTESKFGLECRQLEAGDDCVSLTYRNSAAADADLPTIKTPPNLPADHDTTELIDEIVKKRQGVPASTAGRHNTAATPGDDKIPPIKLIEPTTSFCELSGLMAPPSFAPNSKSTKFSPSSSKTSAASAARSMSKPKLSFEKSPDVSSTDSLTLSRKGSAISSSNSPFSSSSAPSLKPELISPTSDLFSRSSTLNSAKTVLLSSTNSSSSSTSSSPPERGPLISSYSSSISPSVSSSSNFKSIEAFISSPPLSSSSSSQKRRQLLSFSAAQALPPELPPPSLLSVTISKSNSSPGSSSSSTTTSGTSTIRSSSSFSSTEGQVRKVIAAAAAAAVNPCHPLPSTLYSSTSPPSTTFSTTSSPSERISANSSLDSSSSSSSSSSHTISATLIGNVRTHGGGGSLSRKRSAQPQQKEKKLGGGKKPRLKEGERKRRSTADLASSTSSKTSRLEVVGSKFKPLLPPPHYLDGDIISHGGGGGGGGDGQQEQLRNIEVEVDIEKPSTIHYRNVSQDAMGQEPTAELDSNGGGGVEFKPNPAVVTFSKRIDQTIKLDDDDRLEYVPDSGSHVANYAAAAERGDANNTVDLLTRPAVDDGEIIEKHSAHGVKFEIRDERSKYDQDWRSSSSTTQTQLRQQQTSASTSSSVSDTPLLSLLNDMDVKRPTSLKSFADFDPNNNPSLFIKSTDSFPTTTTTAAAAQETPSARGTGETISSSNSRMRRNNSAPYRLNKTYL